MDGERIMLVPKKTRAAWVVACGLLSVLPVSWGGQTLPAAARREALKVIRFLDGVGAESLMKKSGSPRHMVFTESELNSYIAFRIETEKEEVMKELRLKLFERNRIEGKVFVDLRDQKLPSFLKPQMNLYFEGVFVTQDGKVRLDFQKLFLESQPVPVMILDVIVFVASKLGKSDAGSINDWYALPAGIKDIRTRPGRISIYY